MISMQFSDEKRELRNFDLSLQNKQYIYNAKIDLNQIE